MTVVVLLFCILLSLFLPRVGWAANAAAVGISFSVAISLSPEAAQLVLDASFGHDEPQSCTFAGCLRLILARHKPTEYRPAEMT
jgi:hypothetical protein